MSARRMLIDLSGLSDATLAGAAVRTAGIDTDHLRVIRDGLAPMALVTANRTVGTDPTGRTQ